MSVSFPWGVALEERAAEDPDRIAIAVEGGVDLSFGWWAHRAQAVAAGLAGRGITPGQRVALRFDAPHWADFAVAVVGVLKAGAVAVLVPAGLAEGDAHRIVRHAGASGLLAPAGLALATSSAWSAAPDDFGAAAPDGTVEHAADPAAVAELTFPLAPLARPRARARTHAGLVAVGAPCPPGWLAHTWAPGSTAGQWVLGQVLAGHGTTAATLACFSPDGLAQLVARLQATTCGLTPGLAVAVLDAAPAPLGCVSTVLVSRGPRRPLDLTGPFPAATVADLPEEPIDAAPGEEPAPVGPSQVGMLWHEQLAPGSFNLPSLVRRYRGALDIGALDRALAELARRHEPLRTTFELVAGSPTQVVGPPPGELPVTDLRKLAAAEREAEAARLIGEATSRPFDLVEGPLFAPHLLRLRDDDHVLVVRLHHTTFDDWSVDVFRRELSTLYASAVGSTATVPEPPARYVDVCRKQRIRLRGEAGDAQRAYWRNQLAGAPLALRLTLGEPHQLGPDRPGAGEPLRRYLPTILVRDLRALAPRLRATPFMTVLTAFEVLAARRSGLDDLVFATVVAARGSTATERMIGCFTKKVVLRVRLAGDPTFAELVARTRTTVLDALAHQDLPFEAVVQDTLGRAAAEHGLAAQVPVVFQGETPQRFRLAMPGLEVGPFETPVSSRRERHFSTRNDAPPEQAVPWGDGALSETFLLLSLLELDDGMGLVARGVFHRPAVRRLLEDLEGLLTDIVREPDRRVSELGVAPPRPPQADEVDLLGLRLQRTRIEKALAHCPGVAEAAISVHARGGDGDGPMMVAYVVADGRRPPPSLAALREALWKALPGSPWPAAAVAVDRLPYLADGRLDTSVLARPPASSDHPPDPRAALLSSLWAEAGAGAAAPAASYWQDFTFLAALAEARAAGLLITDQQVSRCRTPEMLAAAIAAAGG